MKKLLFAFLFLFASVALAVTLEVKNESLTIQLYDTPCKLDANIKNTLIDMEFSEEQIALAGAASISFKGNVMKGCYILHDDHVDIADELGEGGSVPVEAFKVVPPL